MGMNERSVSLSDDAIALASVRARTLGVADSCENFFRCSHSAISAKSA
jgi:hypothetical protein